MADRIAANLTAPAAVPCLEFAAAGLLAWTLYRQPDGESRLGEQHKKSPSAN